jgi:hypothetical protein
MSVTATQLTVILFIPFVPGVAVEELYGTRYQSGSFSLITVGSGFHSLHSF